MPRLISLNRLKGLSSTRFQRLAFHPEKRLLFHLVTYYVSCSLKGFSIYPELLHRPRFRIIKERMRGSIKSGSKKRASKMAESLRRLVNIGTFTVLQEKLERWLDNYYVSLDKWLGYSFICNDELWFILSHFVEYWSTIFSFKSGLGC